MAAGNRQERLTDAVVRRMPLTDGGQYAVRDTELRGFMVMVGRRSKTFMIQLQLTRLGATQNIKQVVGRADDLTTTAARGAAAKVIADLRAGATRHVARGRAVTLRSAWADYRTSHLERKGRSAGTIANYRDHVERLFTDWLDLPLAELAMAPRMVRDRHAKITRENGPYIANGAMRSLRAIYNWARRKIDRELPPDAPVDSQDFNDEERRDTGMGPAELPAWNAQREALPNEVRREFHLFTLLSGSRPGALKRARWEHLDVARRVLHFPDPKGGARKAFDMPLSRAMLRCLWRARRAGRRLHAEQAATFIFPGDTATGHIVEHKEDRADLSKWANDLRQTYANMAQAVGVPLFFIKTLMNHSRGGDVTLGYVTVDALRSQLLEQQERISVAVMTALIPDQPRGAVQGLRFGRLGSISRAG